MSLSHPKRLGHPALCYLDGERAGPPLVLLHGLGRCAEDYREFAAALTADWHVLAPDFRGHGGSDHVPGQYLVTDYARDALAFVRDGISQPVVIYGHSLGAMVALAVAAELPEIVRGIVLEDPPFHTMGQRIAQTPWRELFQGMRETARSVTGVDQLAAALAELSVSVPGRSSPTTLGQLRSAESLKFSARCLAQLDPEVFTPVIEGRWLDGYDERELYSQVRCPALLLQGDSMAGGAFIDADADEAMTALRTGRRVRFAGVGHLIHQDQSEAALRALQEFATTTLSLFPSHEKAGSLSTVSGI